MRGRICCKLPSERQPALEMSENLGNNDLSASWDALEAKIDQLIERNQALAEENEALRRQQRKWSSERADLVRRNELAKSGLEAMIARLKSLEES